MKTVCLPFSQIPQTTRLFNTFLTDPQRLSAYYWRLPNRDDIKAAASEVRLSSEARLLLVEVLRDQNARFSAGGALDLALSRNLDRLQSGAVAIVTGQQVGLFSGPALTIYKALSALKCAETVEREQIEAVPIFWLATEDHDLAEINVSEWKTRGGLEKYHLPEDGSHAGECVGQIPLPASIASLVQTAASTLEGTAAEEIAVALRESYASGETYGSAFAKLLARLLAGRGILVIDPQDSRFDRFSAPIYRAAIESTNELRTALLERSWALEQAGYHAQVKVAPDSTLLFLNVDNQREPLRSRDGEVFSAGNATFSKQQLLDLLARTPEAFTASALLRPTLQDTILPTAAYIAGPAEVAYLAQSEVVYRRLLARMPAVLARASFTLVEPPIARFMEQYSLDIRDIILGHQHLRAKMEQKALPGELSKRFESDEASLREIAARYRLPIERLDPTLLGAIDSLEEKMLGALQKLKEKVGRAENFRTGVLDRHERILVDSLFAGHELQERHLSALPHLALHGKQLFDDMLQAMPSPGWDSGASCDGQHHVLFLD